MEYIKFIINKTPYCFWDINIKSKNQDYINNCDTSYLSGPFTDYCKIHFKAS